MAFWVVPSLQYWICTTSVEILCTLEDKVPVYVMLLMHVSFLVQKVYLWGGSSILFLCHFSSTTRTARTTTQINDSWRGALWNWTGHLSQLIHEVPCRFRKIKYSSHLFLSRTSAQECLDTPSLMITTIAGSLVDIACFPSRGGQHSKESTGIGDNYYYYFWTCGNLMYCIIAFYYTNKYFCQYFYSRVELCRSLKPQVIDSTTTVGAIMIVYYTVLLMKFAANVS